MITPKPVWKPHYRVQILKKEGVLLLTEDGSKALYGKVYELVAPLLDGSRTPDDIVDAIGEKASPAEIYYAISQLEKKGYITIGKNGFSPGETAYWHSKDLDPVESAEKLQGSSVHIQKLGKVPIRGLSQLLKGLGIGIGGNPDLEVIVTDSYFRPKLKDQNRLSLDQKKPWLLIKPVGNEIWIGPLFVPGKTGCFLCLYQRLQANRLVEHFAFQKNKRKGPPITSTAMNSLTLSTAFNITALEISRYLVEGKNSRLEGKVISIETRTWETQSHTLTQRPQCPECGNKGEHSKNENTHIDLASQKVTFSKDGGHRTATPEETVKKYEHLVSHITGVVTNLSPMGDHDGKVHVYHAGSNHALRFSNLEFLKKGLRSSSGGKGMTDIQAKASALCEAAERRSALYDGTEEKITSSYKELGEQAIHPNTVMRYSDKQYKERRKWNKRDSKFNVVAEPFDEEENVYWSPLWSLTENRKKYLPTQLLYFSAPVGEKSRKMVCMGCSNGNASGNTLEEAILQGFFELVERDAVALWWYNRLKKPGVDIQSFGEPYLVELEKYFPTKNRELWVLDITTDSNIPTFAAMSRRTDKAEEEILFGFGSHLDSRIAIQRAITEHNQGLGWALDDGKENKIEEGEILDWFKNATIENQPYLVPEEKPPMRFEDYPKNFTGDLKEDILYCKKIIEDLRMEILVLDQTRPDIGIPVVKVVVPGLRHFWARFAPGRLYDVPVKMGWLDKPKKEDELNPTPMFL